MAMTIIGGVIIQWYISSCSNQWKISIIIKIMAVGEKWNEEIIEMSKAKKKWWNGKQ